MSTSVQYSILYFVLSCRICTRICSSIVLYAVPVPVEEALPAYFRPPYTELYPPGAVAPLLDSVRSAYRRLFRERDVQVHLRHVSARPAADARSSSAADGQTHYASPPIAAEAGADAGAGLPLNGGDRHEAFELTRWTGEISRARLPLVRAPTLVFALGADPMETPQQTQSLRALIRRSRCVVYYLIWRLLLQCDIYNRVYDGALMKFVSIRWVWISQFFRMHLYYYTGSIQNAIDCAAL